MIKVIDMHCDTIAELYCATAPTARQTADDPAPIHSPALEKRPSILDGDLHVNLEKMEKGGYGLQNFALFTHLERVGERPFEYCMKLADIFFQEMGAHEDRIGVVRSWQDIQENWEKGRMSALLTVEEGGVCQGELAFLRILYQLGVRMMTLTWNFKNELGWPNGRRQTDPENSITVPDTEHGLTEKGLAFLAEMERLGMIVDISHLNDAGIWDVFHHTKKPFVASHSNCRALASHPRNLTDEMIRALAERGGVAGINFCAAFLRDAGAEETYQHRAKDGTRPAGGQKEARVAYIRDMVRHIRHMEQIGGIGVIGLGTDFDGIGNQVEIQDASQMQLLAQAMEQEGFTIGEIEAVFYGNVLRVYKEILS